MYVFSRYARSWRRLIVGLLAVLALFSNTVGTLSAAGTTGSISGTVTDSASNVPIAGVAVTAVSPTGSYKESTDAHGFFAMNGVVPDTYTVSFQLKGYQPVAITGVTVSNDIVADATTKMARSLSTIAHVSVRSVGNAYQPKNTQDTYTVTASQINTLLGKDDSISETNLLTRLPGASIDKYGYPVLRGGRENEEGFEFDGIPETDAFTSQFTNSLELGGNVAQFQLTPGAGDVTTGGAGTGAINLVVKRGTYPGFGQLDFESTTRLFNHQFKAEYGWATPDGRISNYTSFLGYNGAYAQFGEYGTAAASLSTGTFYAPAYNNSRDISDNFVYKFGKNNHENIQLLYDNEQSEFLGVYGAPQVNFPTNDTFILANYLSPFTLLGTSALQNPNLFGMLPFQTCLNCTTDRGGESTHQPQSVFKIGYNNALSSASFLSAKYYQQDSVVTFDIPNAGEGNIFNSFDSLQGGHRTGVGLDFNTQFNSQHLLKAGFSYDFLHPVYNLTDPQDGIFMTSLISSNWELYDFINSGSATCPFGTGVGGPFGSGACGYLDSYFPTGAGPVPYNNEITVTNRQDTSFYAGDHFTPSDKVTLDFGVRVEGTNYQLPPLTGCNQSATAYIASLTVASPNSDSCQYLPTSFTAGPGGVNIPNVNITNDQRHPIIPEPRIAVAVQLTKNDAVRASYSRSAEFAPLAFVDVTTGQAYNKFANVPSFSEFNFINFGTLGGATTCGVLANQACQNYADQLLWEFQNNLEGIPIQPVKPETFSNWDFSYSHQFAGGVGMKITPFYRRGYDALALVSQPRLGANGQPIIDPNTGLIEFGPSTATNLGLSRTAGIEFYLTREVQYGLSASLTANYINEFTNVVPSPLIQEDFFPPIPTQSLDLGNQYRVGFISPFNATLALNYKFHNGLRINPIFLYSRGFPSGVGNLTSQFINGLPVNIPNTNATSAFGATLSPNFVDPQNPGSVFAPNIAATRGTPETASAGGFITNPRMTTNIDFEFSTPGSHNTFGVLIANVFNQTYSSVPTYNSRYQPVATGIAGPKTGMSTTPINFPGEGFQQYLPFQYGQDPYRIVPSSGPQSIRVYYQLGL